MVSLQTLEAVGYNRIFFKLPSIIDKEDHFIYHTFDDSIPSRQPSYWNIVGVHRHHKETFLLDTQMLYIDEEALDWPPFEALHDADSFLSLQPSQLQALIQFLEGMVDHQIVIERGDGLRYFHLMDADELAGVHLPPWAIKRGVDDYYQYVPDQDIQGSEKISLLSLPRWSTSSGYSQSSSLWFATFDQQRLDDSAFHPLDMEWSGMMTFNQRALQELIVLLKQRTYDKFVRASQA